MNEYVFIQLMRDALVLIIKVSAPMLIVSLVIGLVVSIFQTVTSIQEQTLTFVPKLLGIFLVLILAGNWIMRNIVDYFVMLMQSLQSFITR